MAKGKNKQAAPTGLRRKTQSMLEGRPAPPEFKGKTQTIPKEKAKALSAYTNMAMQMIHGEQSSPKIVEMLKSGPPEVSIPNTALTINQYIEQGISSNQGNVQKDVVLAAATPIVSDLIDVGNGEGIFNVEKEEAREILQDSMQQYIEAGVKDGSIDPIKLQNQVAPLMNKDRAMMGVGALKSGRIPPAPTRTMINNKIRSNAVMEYRGKQPQGQPQGQPQARKGVL